MMITSPRGHRIRGIRPSNPDAEVSDMRGAEIYLVLVF